MHCHFKQLLVGLIATVSVAAVHAQAEHLVLSEIGKNTGPNNEGEFIEIFNPSASAVDLTNYWFTDHNTYKDLPAEVGGMLPTGTTDNIVRFPAGTMLQSGQVAVIVGDADSFIGSYFDGNLANFTGQTGSPLLFEVGGANATVPNMEARNSNTEGPLNFNFTNAGEFAILFYWDGVADLVKDVDIVSWGEVASGQNMFQPKLTTHTGKNGTPYLADAGNHASLSVGSVSHLYRTSIAEPSEVQTGGNGLLGHDESTEISANSWAGGTLDDISPGVTNLTTVAENVPPLINSLNRNVLHPSSTQPVTLTANVEDANGSVASVNVFYDSGSGFTPVPATSAGSGNWNADIGPFADGTTVRYYVEATDDDSANSVAPPNAPTDTYTFIVDDDPVLDGDIVINEVLYDDPGGDGYEFVELYNTRATAVDVSGYRFADGNFSYYTLPEGAEIPAGGYLVLSLDPDALQGTFGTVVGVQYYDWGNFGLNNGGDTLVLVHPNGYLFNGTTVYLDEVVYTSEEPWPVVGGTDRSIELIHPSLDNSLPESWRSAQPLATPGSQNTVYSPILLSEFTRDIDFPAANEAVTVSVKAEPLGASPVSAVRLYVDSGSGFMAANMTLSATPDVYTAQIGGFPEGAIVRYYVEAENSLAETVTLPTNAPVDFNVILVGDTPLQSGDVVINEILYDTFGSDTNSYEFIELYNNTGEVVDLSYFRVIDNQNIPYAFPEGTTIGPDSYVVITMNDTAFRAIYGTIPSLYSWENRFGLANGGDTVQLIHPNLFSFTGDSIPMESVSYTTTAPWPNWTDPADHPDATGRSIELINPNYQDRYTNGERWDWTTNVVLDDPELQVRGTPGAQNSVFSNSSVTDWSVY